MLSKKYVHLLKKIISFTFWGVLTTALNVVLYYLFRRIRISVQISTALAWFLCVLFAFVTNKKYVFNGGAKETNAIIREAIYFYGSRLFSGIADVLIMSLFVDILKFNEVFSKITDEILISAFNFVFSFLVIFKEKKSDNLVTLSSAETTPPIGSSEEIKETIGTGEN